MQPASSNEQGDTVQRSRWPYSTVDWNYPPTPAASYNALLARGASHSRFLRIAYLTTRERSTTPSRLNDSPLHRRKPHWPKPPHYHASLLHSPLSRRKGLFRAILSPNKAVDFARWDFFASPGAFSKQASQPCTSLHVAECVLEPYEAAAGFSGWRGLGIDVTRRVRGDDECPWSGHVERSSDLRRDIDEATVDEGRARWACLAEELVGPPGIALRWIQDDKSTKASPYARQEVRWDPDIGASPFRPPRATPAPDDKRSLAPSSTTTSTSSAAPRSKPQLKVDSPSAWWYAPSSHRPPHLPPLRFPHTPHVQYGPPPLPFPPYFPGRLASAQGHGDWYAVQPTGAPSVNLPVKSHPPHSHSHAMPTHVHSSKCPRHPLNSRLGRDEYEPGPDGDKETETDHDYESTTTTTDSDPPPHTPIGAATTSHCVEAPQIHGDDDETEHGSVALKVPLSDPTTPVKLLPRFITSPSISSGSPDLNRGGHEPSKTVVFPSLNGSFRQGSLSQTSVFSSNQGTSTPTTPGRATTTRSSVSLSTKVASPPGSSDEDTLESPLRHDNPAFTLSLSSPPPTSPGSALRRDSQGFWEPISPCSSLSSLPLSPSEGKFGETGRPVESPKANGSYLPKCRSLSPSPRRETSVDSSLSSSSRPTAFSSPTSTPASVSVFGGSYPCSPSNGTFLFPPKPTTLLPAFMATTGEKRKKTSRTREIVDQLRSSSIDAGKGVEGQGWLAVGGEVADKASDHSVETHVATQPSSSPQPKSGSDLTPLSVSGKNHSQAPGGSTSRGSGGKTNGKATGSETCSPTSTRTGATTSTHSLTPFPILSVSQTVPSNLTAHSASDSSKTNVVVKTSPNARSQLLPDAPKGGTSPSRQHSHHPLPSPTQPTVHLQPVLGPPVLAVAAYPPPMYVPQYNLVPPHGQGGWVAMYPGRPAHIPVHPIPSQVHITGVSGMRHVSW